MNRKLKNELATLLGLSAVAAAISKNRKLAFALGLFALGTRIYKLKPDFNFRNKTVILAGGSRGLGLALAQELLDQGAFVYILARDLGELELAEEILKTKTGLTASHSVCDVTDPTELSNTFSQILKETGEIDVLVNTTGPLNAAQQASDLLIPYFKKRGEGRIVNIFSKSGQVPALDQLGIKVLSVIPGLAFSASTAAEKIVDAIRLGQSTLSLSAPSIFPEILNATHKIAHRSHPNGVSQERRTGAASRHWIDENQRLQ